MGRRPNINNERNDDLRKTLRIILIRGKEKGLM